MELKKFINVLQQNVGLRTLLPLNQGLLYPYFEVRDGQLYAHFLANASTITPEGMLLYPPAYHVLASYPQGQILCVENLRYAPAFRDVDFSATTLLEKKSPEEREEARAQMAQLNQLVEDVLKNWECADVAAYHRQLACVLTDQQMQMYLKVAGCE